MGNAELESAVVFYDDKLVYAIWVYNFAPINVTAASEGPFKNACFGMP